MFKVWCEWDMGFSNIDDHNSVFETMEQAVYALEKADWPTVEYVNYEEAEADGMLTIEEV